MGASTPSPMNTNFSHPPEEIAWAIRQRCVDQGLVDPRGSSTPQPVVRRSGDRAVTPEWVVFFQLTEWAQVGDGLAIYDVIEALSTHQLHMAQRWFERVRGTSEYRADKHKTGVAVVAVMKTVAADAVFRDTFFGHLQANPE